MYVCSLRLCVFNFLVPVLFCTLHHLHLLFIAVKYQIHRVDWKAIAVKVMVNCGWCGRWYLYNMNRNMHQFILDCLHLQIVVGLGWWMTALWYLGLGIGDDWKECGRRGGVHESLPIVVLFRFLSIIHFCRWISLPSLRYEMHTDRQG